MRKELLKSFLFVFILTVLIAGCENPTTENITNIVYQSDSLTNPDVEPRVIFSNPADGAVGPFGTTAIRLQETYPKIVVQFNKLIELSSVKLNTYSLEMDGIKQEINFQYSSFDLYNDILVFTTQQTYPAYKTFTFTIDTTMLDIHGKRLAEPYVASFTPEPKFRLRRAFPGSDVVEPLSTRQIALIFNSKVDGNLFKSLSISPAVNGEWIVSPDSFFQDSLMALFQLPDTLSYNTEYKVAISSDAKDHLGLPINSSYEYSFVTNPFNVRLASRSAGIGPGGFNIFHYFDFSFNAPLDTATVRNGFSITPEISYDIDFITGSLLNDISINFNSEEFEENTEYTIRLTPAIKSIFGDSIEEYTYTFRTGSL